MKRKTALALFNVALVLTICVAVGLGVRKHFTYRAVPDVAKLNLAFAIGSSDKCAIIGFSSPETQRLHLALFYKANTLVGYVFYDNGHLYLVVPPRPPTEITTEEAKEFTARAMKLCDPDPLPST